MNPDKLTEATAAGFELIESMLCVVYPDDNDPRLVALRMLINEMRRPSTEAVPAIGNSEI